jgi:hypothetical protein
LNGFERNSCGMARRYLRRRIPSSILLRHFSRCGIPFNRSCSCLVAPNASFGPKSFWKVRDDLPRLRFLLALLGVHVFVLVLVPDVSVSFPVVHPRIACAALVSPWPTPEPFIGTYLESPFTYFFAFSLESGHLQPRRPPEGSMPGTVVELDYACLPQTSRPRKTRDMDVKK